MTGGVATASAGRGAGTRPTCADRSTQIPMVRILGGCRPVATTRRRTTEEGLVGHTDQLSHPCAARARR